MTYRLLIVDDEPHVVESIIDLLSQVVDLDLDLYRAYSAKQALEVLEAGRIDLVISDIEMPAMNGLELIRHIHEKWPTCRVAFLTAYPSFQYAYEAIALHSAGYILKTENDMTIVQKIKDILQEIKNSYFLTEPQMTSISVVPERGDFLKDTAPELVSETLQSLHFSAGKTAFCLLLCQFDVEVTASQMQTIHHILKYYLNENIPHMVYQTVNEKQMVELLELPSEQKPEFYPHIIDLLELAQASCYSILNIKLSSVVHPFDISGMSPNEALCIAQLHLPRIQDTFVPLFCDVGLSNETKTNDSVFNLPQQTVEWLKQYIRRNLSGDISMMRLSSLTGYNAQYLSGIFHQYANQTVTRFIAQERLKLVRQMLSVQNASFYDVMKAAGFSSRSYFNRFIKRETDMTPQQLRAQLLSENADVLASITKESSQIR